LSFNPCNVRCNRLSRIFSGNFFGYVDTLEPSPGLDLTFLSKWILDFSDGGYASVAGTEFL
jgi:hypothetical protein